MWGGGLQGIPETLRSLEVGDVRWQPVPVTDGLRIKREIYALLWPVAGLDAWILWNVGRLAVQSLGLCQ